MYGALLPRNERGSVNGGLGQTTSAGTVTLIVPSDFVSKTGTEIAVDGVNMVFQMTPGTEAPAEMNTFFPQFKAMWMAENSTNTHAQHPDTAWSASARCTQVGVVPQRNNRTVWKGR